MRKGIKITLAVTGGVLAVLAAELCVLLFIGFRFSSAAAVHSRYHDNTVLHTDEYDFYLDDVKNSDGETCYADGHAAVKRYGFLYKQIVKKNTADKTHWDLVAENGERVGSLYTYEGDGKTYAFIHWSGVADGNMIHEDDGSVSAYVTYKYWTDTVILNGKETELYLNCYFVSEEPIEALVIRETNVYMKNGQQ